MKRSEYEALALEFRVRLAAGDFPEGDEWLSVPGTSTCTTPNCHAFGVTCAVRFHENADGVYRGICGPCGQPTEVKLTLEDG
ncbi:hypothetical protein [Streptomyces termitum]|uniref:hypothetical protein n=1 Tax=Streptomyces termitum TaxID=67368 RepID=UPI0033B5DDA7